MVESLARSLAQHPFTGRLPARMVDFLAGCAKNMRFDTGEYLFREGEEQQHLFLIRQGQVDVESYLPGRGEVALESFTEGEALGASAVFAPYEWNLDGRAVKPVLVFAIDGDCLRRKIDEDAEFGRAVLKELLIDVHRRLSELRLSQMNVYKRELSES